MKEGSTVRGPQPQAMAPPGSYVNFLRVAHAPAEFHLTFGQLAPGQAPAARLVSALVTTPMHAKAMLRALASAIERYEEQFGEVPAIEPKPAAARPAGERQPPRAAKRKAS